MKNVKANIYGAGHIKGTTVKWIGPSAAFKEPYVFTSHSVLVLPQKTRQIACINQGDTLIYDAVTGQKLVAVRRAEI